MVFVGLGGWHGGEQRKRVGELVGCKRAPAVGFKRHSGLVDGDGDPREISLEL